MKLGKRRDEPFYDTDAPTDPRPSAVVHWCESRTVSELNAAFPSFYFVEYDDRAFDRTWGDDGLPSWALDDDEEGLYVASAYWKGERWGRGRTPDEAAQRVMSKVAAVALFYEVHDTVRYKELRSELSDYVARGMPAPDCDDLCAWWQAGLLRRTQGSSRD